MPLGRHCPDRLSRRSLLNVPPSLRVRQIVPAKVFNSCSNERFAPGVIFCLRDLLPFVGKNSI